MDSTFIDRWVGSFATVEEIVASQTEEPDWLLKGLLLPGTYMIVFGREGLGKSRIIYQLAHSFQTGRPWFGIEVCKTGPVLYLETDMSPEQSAALIRDAHGAGFVGGNIIFPTAYGILNVLDSTGRGTLEALSKRFQPVLVIVDTATDVFDGDETNQTVKEVIRAFRIAFPNSGILFIMHERKRSQFMQAKGVEDEDAYLGAGEWSRKASGAIRFKGINDTHAKIMIRKTRSVVPWKELIVRRNEFGFFDVESSKLDVKQALALWPAIEGVDPTEPVESISAVCRSIEKATGGRLKADAVRKAYQRAVQERVEFPWMRQLGQRGWDTGEISDPHVPTEVK